jgi:hypothetical protein
MPSLRHSLLIFGVLAFAATVAWGQDSSQPDASSSAPNTQQQPQLPAYGSVDALPISDNPPLSGLDQPGLQPHAAPISYIQPGATVSESFDSNVSDSLGGSSASSITRALGSLTLERLWSHYDLALQYMGGTAYYNQRGLGWKLLQQMDVDQKVTWKRGQLSVRDSFSYLPEGNFGAAYGSLGSQGIASLGNTAFGSFWGGTTLGGLGEAPRLMNLALVDVSENLTPKSAVTATGGYAITHFYGDDLNTGISFIGSSQISAQVGYNRALSAHTQVALVYGYQSFDFSVLGSAFHSHVIQGMYGHRISGRMDFLIGAGPQITFLDNTSQVCSVPGVDPSFCGVFGGTLSNSSFKSTRIGVAGRARLRYKFPKTMLDLTYERYETSGSGLFAGAQTDLARLSAERPLSRVWSAFTDLGYSRNSRLQPTSGGVQANTYSYGFVGAGVHRAFGRNFHGFASYQFNEISFDTAVCGLNTACGRISNRHVVTIGLDWTPRPIRID